LDRCSRSIGVTFLDSVKRFSLSLAFSSTPIINASFKFSFITNSENVNRLKLDSSFTYLRSEIYINWWIFKC
jgi:hypothetical protein